MTGGERGRTALVLSGGGARGAYEAGVVRYLREELAPELGYQPRFDVLSGTSIGAVNACVMASTADVPAQQGVALAAAWRSLKLEKVFHWSALNLAALPGYVVRQLRATRMRHLSWRLSDFVFPEALAQLVHHRIDWPRLHRNVRDGHVGALTVSATDLGTGRAVVFVESLRALPEWSRDPLVEARACAIGPAHALASGAIPLLFRPVRIEDSWFVDGSVRQNTPLAPALRLGAERVLVIALRAEGRKAERAPRLHPEEVPTTAAQLGRLLNALLLDHADYDIDRLRHVNAMMDRAEQVFGPGFAEQLASISARELGAPFRRVRELVIRPSRDIGVLAHEHAARRVRHLRPGTLAARLLRRAAADTEAAADGAADLASFLLFDGDFADELMALGHADARRSREALRAFFAEPAAAGARTA
ncbi:patatin-like phospholipase family protein [Anaeromyxobacter dehalogenans]|uniref:Patatin n=1 Tax=Anaeromyxobacter dehalogenans (strain 2CP-C) TaxID=290397 RepID=Q2IIS2_ANADE|nr:patatin-like phospholipase family protein [Anaeromyxobacter dehalogenans]ABC81550.1 Patatin [Anaeromyxobacter dehalogenans 2CP-C]